MVKLSHDESAVDAQLDEEGNPIPGTGSPGKMGVDYTDIISVDWIKSMLGQKDLVADFDNPEDLEGE